MALDLKVDNPFDAFADALKSDDASLDTLEIGDYDVAATDDEDQYTRLIAIVSWDK